MQHLSSAEGTMTGLIMDRSRIDYGKLSSLDGSFGRSSECSRPGAEFGTWDSETLTRMNQTLTLLVGMH